MIKLFKALGASVLSLGLVVIGAASSASAATIYPTATATGAIGTTGTNAYPITFTATTVGSTANLVQFMLPSGWTFALTPPNNCSWITVSGITPNSCAGNNGGGVMLQMSSQIPSNTTVTVIVPANTFNVAATRNFPVLFNNNSSGLVTVDSGIAVLAGGVSNSTVTFNANGGSGAMADQTGSSATALSANAFTRSGYVFAGWNTAANGSGTSYADGASYAFSSSTTLYAQWTPTLATTGFDSKPYLYTAFAFAIAGAALMLLSSRRKQDI